MVETMLRLSFIVVTFLAICAQARPKLHRQRRGISQILNSDVVFAELYARKASTGKGFDHYGVVVTTSKGERWLVHKGFNFSRSSHTVVTSAKHMTGRWKITGKQKVEAVKVRDYLETAGKFFHPHFDNAFHAAKRMMKIGKLGRKDTS